jgi:hypothetical protein
MLKATQVKIDTWLHSMWLGQNYFVKFFFVATIYTSEKTDCDESGDGSEIKPFKTVIQVNLIFFYQPLIPLFIYSYILLK